MIHADMITQYFPEAIGIKARLDDILDSEIARRASLGLDSPEEVKINLLLEASGYGGSSERVNGDITVHLNILYEVIENHELFDKYQSKIDEINHWVRNVRPLVAPDRVNVIGNELFEVLQNPVVLDSIDQTAFSPELREHYENTSSILKEKVPKIKAYVTEILEEIAKGPLSHLQGSLRHELEHTTPEYAEALQALHSMGEQLFRDVDQYGKSQEVISLAGMKRRIKRYLDLSSRLYPDGEAKAYMCERFMDNMDEKGLKELKDSIEMHLVKEYLPITWKDVIISSITNILIMEATDRGKEPDSKTIGYVHSVVFQGTSRSSQYSVDTKGVNYVLANRMFRQIGYWENKFKEGIKLGLDRAETFYQSKLKQTS